MYDEDMLYIPLITVAMSLMMGLLMLMMTWMFRPADPALQQALRNVQDGLGKPASSGYGQAAKEPGGEGLAPSASAAAAAAAAAAAQAQAIAQSQAIAQANATAAAAAGPPWGEASGSAESAKAAVGSPLWQRLGKALAPPSDKPSELWQKTRDLLAPPGATF
jgi:predicted lipid-binding transport protein (Tim44 family)